MMALTPNDVKFLCEIGIADASPERVTNRELVSRLDADGLPPEIVAAIAVGMYREEAARADRLQQQSRSRLIIALVFGFSLSVVALFAWWPQ